MYLQKFEIRPADEEIFGGKKIRNIPFHFSEISTIQNSCPNKVKEKTILLWKNVFGDKIRNIFGNSVLFQQIYFLNINPMSTCEHFEKIKWTFSVLLTLKKSC